MKKEDLNYENKNRFSELPAKAKKEVFDFCEEYRQFLSAAKTEREFCEDACRILEANGFVTLESEKQLKAGDKVYSVNRGKGVFAAVIGKNAMEEGISLVGAHIDSPRLDLKPNPLYEEQEIAYLKTHYYGGIKKYQWTTMPLSIHGVAVLQDGTQIKLVIGESADDPVFCVTDLLPHLAAQQMAKKMNEAISGESLNVILGNICSEDKEAKEGVKQNILSLLYEKYGIKEEDLLSSEIEVVPAYEARDVGLDRSMIGGYGQDDRVCAFTSLAAMLEVGDAEYTTCCLLVDKEEIGSVGATGMRSQFFENTVAEVLAASGQYTDLALRRCLANSKMLSSDVSAAFDPTYAFAYEKKNAAYFGRGMVFNKFTGSRGKSGSNDANAEFMAQIRGILKDAKVAYQTAELGKVDVGGGGTIAYIMALYGMDVIDCGVAVLNMHAPWEITSKADIYETKKGYVEFLKKIMLC